MVRQFKTSGAQGALMSMGIAGTMAAVVCGSYELAQCGFTTNASPSRSLDQSRETAYRSGLIWTGAIPTRDDDQLGLGMTVVKFSEARGAGFHYDDEVCVESYYMIRALKWLKVKPDVQYIVHPGGIAGQSNALALTLQILADF